MSASACVHLVCVLVRVCVCVCDVTSLAHTARTLNSDLNNTAVKPEPKPDPDLGSDTTSSCGSDHEADAQDYGQVEEGDYCVLARHYKALYFALKAKHGLR